MARCCTKFEYYRQLCEPRAAAGFCALRFYLDDSTLVAFSAVHHFRHWNKNEKLKRVSICTLYDSLLNILFWWYNMQMHSYLSFFLFVFLIAPVINKVLNWKPVCVSWWDPRVDKLKMPKVFIFSIGYHEAAPDIEYKVAQNVFHVKLPMKSTCSV